jgi:transglutaminase-like putative cysteine protease
VIRLSFAIGLEYEIAGQPADFVLNIHASRTPWQAVVSESLAIDPPLAPVLHDDPVHGNRYLRLRAGPGLLAVRYEAAVDLEHHLVSPELLAEVPIASLPAQALPFIYPSRYCQSDRLRDFAAREFGHLPAGHGRVQAIRDWVCTRTAFRPGSSNSSTSALDTLVERTGVCRDFAHLMIAMCRALNIPARFVTSIDYGAAAELGPPDFHAFVEAFLGDRWYSFDPTGIASPMGLVRIGTGRDAADVSFATIFGCVASRIPVISIAALDAFGNACRSPHPAGMALSTSSEGTSPAAQCSIPHGANDVSWG